MPFCKWLRAPCYDFKFICSKLKYIFLKNTFVLLVWFFSPHSRIYHIYGNVTIADEGLHILNYARLSLSSSSEVFFSVEHLPWHGISVYKDHLRKTVTLTLVLALCSGAVTTCFLRLISVAAKIRTPNLPHAMRLLLLTAAPRWFVLYSFCSFLPLKTLQA